MPSSFMPVHPYNGGYDAKPKLLSKSDGFILQLLRVLLEDSPQLSTPHQELFEQKKASSSKVMYPFWGFLYPMTDQCRDIRAQSSPSNEGQL